MLILKPRAQQFRVESIQNVNLFSESKDLLSSVSSFSVFQKQKGKRAAAKSTKKNKKSKKKKKII